MTRPDLLCIGSVLWDVIGRCPRPMHLGADMPGRITRLPGGVAMNLAMTLAGLGLRPALLTAIGEDREGQDLLVAAAELGLEIGFVHRPPGLPTDVYMAIEDAGGLVAALADAHTLEAAGRAILAPLHDGRLGSRAAPYTGLIALDGNLTTALLADIARDPAFSAADLRLAPASPGKAERLRPLLPHPRATLYVNREEAGLLLGQTFPSAGAAAEALVASGAARALVTDGAAPLAEARAGAPLLQATPPRVEVARITGAGDTFMAAHIAAELQGQDRATALQRALKAAAAYVAGPAPAERIA